MFYESAWLWALEGGSVLTSMDASSRAALSSSSLNSGEAEFEGSFFLRAVSWRLRVVTSFLLATSSCCVLASSTSLRMRERDLGLGGLGEAGLVFQELGCDAEVDGGGAVGDERFGALEGS